MASLTGFAPVISCMRGRHVGWTTPQGLVKAPNPKIQIPKKLEIPILQKCPLDLDGRLEFGTWDLFGCSILVGGSFRLVSPAGLSPSFARSYGGAGQQPGV